MEGIFNAPKYAFIIIIIIIGFCSMQKSWGFKILLVEYPF